jgi:hypothetical protein
LDEAAKHYARTLELGGKDADLFLEYGRVLSYANRLADAIDILGKGAGLYPDDDRIRFELGSAYIRHGNYLAALAELGGMKKVLPAQAYRYFYNLAFAEYRLGRTADAKAHAAKARTFAHSSEDAASLDSLDRSLDRPATQTDSGGTPRAAGNSDAAPIPAHRQPDRESDAPKAQPAPALPSVAGIFEHLECGKSARVHVRVDGRILIYVIADPTSVEIRGGDGATVDLQCGPQKPPRPIRIEYEPVAGQPDAPGVVRALEFQ